MQNQAKTLEELLDPALPFPVKPFNERLIIFPDPAKDMTKGGIYIPDTAKERSRIGTVVAAAEGSDKYPRPVEIGERVVFSDIAGSDLVIGGATFRVMRWTELIGRLDTEIDEDVTTEIPSPY